MFTVIRKVVETLLSKEQELNELDNLVGDGDCGSTLKQGALGKSFLRSGLVVEIF